MANKKTTPEDSLSALLGKLTNDEQSELLDILQDMSDTYASAISETFYRYQCPNYKKLTKSLAPCLEPILETDEIDDKLKAELMRGCSSISKEELEDALRNLVLCIFVEFKDTKEPEFMFLVVAVFWVMEHYELEDCLDIVLEILRQDYDFYAVFFNTKLASLLAIMIYQLGKNRLDELQEFMKEPGLIPFGKYFVADAVAHIAVETPERRAEVMDWFCKILDCYLEKMAAGEPDIPFVTDHISKCLLDIRGVEALPVLEKINAKYSLPNHEAPAFETLKRQMPGNKITGMKFTTIDEYLDKNDIDYYVMRFDDDDYDPSYFDLDDDRF